MSSSDSEDENMKQFAEAVDTSLFNNEFYKPKEENEEKIMEEPIVELKSQRYLDNTDNIFKSELNISENMKEFIGQKLSKLIEESVEYIDIKSNKKVKQKTVDRVKLLKGFDEIVDINKVEDIDYPKCKVPISRRRVENDELDESLKIQQATIDTEQISQQACQWDEKIRHKVIKFKKSSKSDEKCHIIEETNEFTKSRQRNGWSESKIKEAKYFNKGLHTLGSTK